jgi:acyl dehydratase
LTQVPVIAGLVRAAVMSARPKKGPAPTTPSEWIEETIPPRPEQLIRDYVRHVGGDPSWYRGRVPAHLFPQWGFPIATRLLAGLPYPLARAMNGGCRLEQRAPLPAGEPLRVRARLESVDDNGQRAIVTTRIVTGTAEVPEAVVGELRAFIPLKKVDKKSNGGAARQQPTVPRDAHEIAFFRVGPDAGLDFAKLTGDFNPIHWIERAAKASGFRSCILHGFSTLARAIEALDRARFAGNPSALRLIDARFTRPLVLPARVGVYVGRDAQSIWVGDAPGGGAYLEGRFETNQGNLS